MPTPLPSRFVVTKQRFFGVIAYRVEVLTAEDPPKALATHRLGPLAWKWPPERIDDDDARRLYETYTVEEEDA